MALTKTSTQVVTSQTITSSSSYTDTTGTDLTTAISCAVGYTMTFNASATAGATIEIYADPDSASQTFTVGTYHDPTDSFEIPVDAGNAVEGMVQINCAPKYIKVRIVNNDTGQSITLANAYVVVQTA